MQHLINIVVTFFNYSKSATTKEFPMFTFKTKFSQLIPLSFILLITACSDNNQQAVIETPYAQASISQLEVQDSYHVPRAYIGKITTNQFSPLSFEYGGTLEQLLVDNGDSVKQGEVLARLNTELISIKVAELNAQIAQNKAQATLNQANLDRIVELKKNSYASDQRLDELTAEQAVLKANLKQLTASLDSLNYQLNRSELVAPFDGVVSNRLLSVGALIQPGNPVLQLIKENDNEVKVGISTQLAKSLKVGQYVRVDIDGESYQGTIIRIGKQINPSNRTVNLRVAISNDIQSYNDQLAKVIIEQTINQVGYWVPIDALTDGVRGQWNILKAVPESDHFRLELNNVKVHYTTDSMAFISGIDGEQMNFVQQGVHKYVPNQLVTQQLVLLAEQ